MFRPVIVLDGSIVGIWKRIIKKEHMLIETQLVKNFSSGILHDIENQLVNFASFFNKKVQIQHGLLLRR